MNNIAINYIILNHIESDVLSRIVDSCRSTKYKVSLIFNDFSLDKNIAKQLEDINKDNINLSTINCDYEDSNNAMNIIVDGFVAYSDSTIVSMVHENLIFKSGIFDTLDLDILDTYGFIYGDYDIQGIRCYLRSHAASIKLSIPFVFWSTKKLIESISLSPKDALEYMFNNYMGFHIPKSLCTIISNDE